MQFEVEFRPKSIKNDNDKQNSTEENVHADINNYE